MNKNHDPKTGQFTTASKGRWTGGATRQATKLMNQNRVLSEHQMKFGSNKTAERIKTRNAKEIRSLVRGFGAKV